MTIIIIIITVCVHQKACQAMGHHVVKYIKLNYLAPKHIYPVID